MPWRPEDRWGDIVSPLMVSDNYLLGLDRLLHSDTTTALLRTSGEKKAKAKRAPRMKGQAKPAPRKVKRLCHSLGKRRRTKMKRRRILLGSYLLDRISGTSTIS